MSSGSKETVLLSSAKDCALASSGFLWRYLGVHMRDLIPACWLLRPLMEAPRSLKVSWRERLVVPRTAATGHTLGGFCNRHLSSHNFEAKNWYHDVLRLVPLRTVREGAVPGASFGLLEAPLGPTGPSPCMSALISLFPFHGDISRTERGPTLAI